MFGARIGAARHPTRHGVRYLLSLTSLSRRRLSQAVVLMAVSTLVAALCWQAAGPSPALRQTRQPAASMTVVDLFPDPPSVAGVVIKAKDSNFPSVLEQPAEIAKYIPMPDFDPSDVLFAPLEVPDLFTALFVRRRVKSARSAGATARWSDGLGPTHPARGRQRARDDPPGALGFAEGLPHPDGADRVGDLAGLLGLAAPQQHLRQQVFRIR